MLQTPICDLRCLSVRQPWASALLWAGPGAKRIENRAWGPSGPLPMWVVLHASAAVDHFRGAELDAPAVRALAALDPRLVEDPRSLPRAAILGMIRVDRVVDLAEVSRDPWAVGPRCWVIGRALVLPEPLLQVPGALNLWPLEGTKQHRERHVDRMPSRDERIEALMTARPVEP